MGSLEKLVLTLSSVVEEDEACAYALQLSLSHNLPTVLNAATELELFDILARAGPGSEISPSEIAAQLPVQNPDACSVLDQILRLLASHSLLTCSLQSFEDGIVKRWYGLAAAGKFFVKSNDGGSLAPLLALAYHPATKEVWFRLKDAILEGGNQFEKLHGITIFKYMDMHPAFNKVYNRALADRSTIAMKEILKAYKGFEGQTSLVDVGGGIGKSLKMIVFEYPSIRGINFDLPRVIESAPSWYRACWRRYVCKYSTGGCCYDKGEIQNICHDWSDEQCMKILKNCYGELPKDGKVIIVDIVMPDAPQLSVSAKYASQLDTTMVLNHRGKETTKKEFEAV